MQLFIKKHSIIIIYFLICSLLIIKAEIDCIGVSDLGRYFCSEIEYAFLKWLLMPAALFGIYFPNFEAIYNQFYQITIHAEFYVLVITLLVNTTLVFLAIQAVKKIISQRIRSK